MRWGFRDRVAKSSLLVISDGSALHPVIPSRKIDAGAAANSEASFEMLLRAFFRKFL